MGENGREKYENVKNKSIGDRNLMYGRNVMEKEKELNPIMSLWKML